MGVLPGVGIGGVMNPEVDILQVESDRSYVVYDGKSGVIVLVHRVITHRGGARVSDEQGVTRALEMASRFGLRSKQLRVLCADKFDGGVPQKVDVKAGQLVLLKPAKPRRP